MKKKKIIKVCNNCTNCIYIGEGDFICDIDEPVLVIEDFVPTDDYCICNGADFESEDYYEREE